MKHPRSGVVYLQPPLAAEPLQGESCLRHILLLDHLGRVPRNGVSWVSLWSADKIPLRPSASLAGGWVVECA